MARREIIVLEDDLDGGEAAETFSFVFDGTGYEIDLSEPNADDFRGLMQRYVDHARRTGRVNGTTPVRRSATRRTPVYVDREQNRAVREWAERTGKPVANRGRIPQAIVDEYNAQAGVPRQQLPEPSDPFASAVL